MSRLRINQNLAHALDGTLLRRLISGAKPHRFRSHLTIHSTADLGVRLPAHIHARLLCSMKGIFVLDRLNMCRDVGIIEQGAQFPFKILGQMVGVMDRH